MTSQKGLQVFLKKHQTTNFQCAYSGQYDYILFKYLVANLFVQLWVI